MSNFKYAPRSPEAWKKREKGNTFEGFIKDEHQGFSPKKDNWVRFLPPTWPDANHYGIDIWVHYSVGPENASVLCLYKMTGKPCPICEAHASAEASGREDADKLKPTRRVLVWLINRNEKEKKAPQYWAQPQTFDAAVTKICRDRVTGQIYYIDHPDQGFDVTFDKDGEGMTTKYTGHQIARQTSSVEQEYLDYALKFPLPDILLWRTYDEVKDLFEGLAGPASPIQPKQEAQALPPAQPVFQPAPPPPPVPSVPSFPPEGWTAHPAAPGFYYQGQEVLSEADLKAKMTAPPVPAPLLPPPPPMVAAPTNSGAIPVAAPPSASDRAAGLRGRFKTGPQ